MEEKEATVMKTALYARVSTAAQGEEDKASIPTQVADIQAYCDRKGYQITDRYVDIGYSGSKKHRPQFQRMLRDAKDGKFDAIVCWKSDRLSRGMYPAAALLEVVEPLGIKLEAVEETLDMNYFSLLAVVGKIELDSIRIRTQFGREARARKQLHPGGHYIDYGYQLQDGQIIINEAEAKWIRDLFSWIASGKSARSWCQYANTHGYVGRNGGQGVTVQQVSVWLRNTIYKGEYQWNKSTKRSGKRRKLPTDKHITISCPAIVSPELWNVVQERLKLNRRYSKGNGKNFFLLRGLLRCRECGKSFSGGTNEGRRYYECYGTRNHPHRYQCRRPHRIKAVVLEERCWEEIIEQIAELVREDDIVGHLIDSYDANRANIATDLKRKREAIENCSWQRQLIAKRERQGYLSIAEAELQYRAINAEADVHQAEIEKLEQMQSEYGDIEQFNDLRRRVDWLHKHLNWFGTFSDASDENKRAFLEEVVDSIIICGHDLVEVRLKLPNPQLSETLASLSMHHTTCRMTGL